MGSKSFIPQSTSVLSPPTISLSDELLSSRILLPPDPCISYAVFAPSSTSQPTHEIIEAARSCLLSRNGSATLVDSLLISIPIGINPTIYVFLISAYSLISNAMSTLGDLRLDGLTREPFFFFVFSPKYQRLFVPGFYSLSS